MSSPTRGHFGHADAVSVLVVSEDPELIHEAHKTFPEPGFHVVGCLGPAQGPCNLETREVCPLAAHSDVAIVDSPASGRFACHWRVVPSGEYAERLAVAHPDCFVILCGAPEGRSGPTGEVAQALSAHAAMWMLRGLGMAHATITDGPSEVPARREARR